MEALHIVVDPKDARQRGSLPRHGFLPGSLLQSACMVALLALACGCGGAPAEKTNDITLLWSVQGGRCTDAGLHNVEVDLLDHGGVLYDSNTFLCAGGRGGFTAVPAGKYTLRLSGLDAEGHATYAGGPASLQVRSGTEPIQLLPPIEMKIRRAAIDVVWSFDGGGLCGTNGISKIEVAVWDPFIGQQVAGAVTDCDLAPEDHQPILGTTIAEGFGIDGLVPRPVRLRVFGLDTQGIRRYIGMADPLTLVPGEIMRAAVRLFPCGGEANIGCQ